MKLFSVWKRALAKGIAPGGVPAASHLSFAMFAHRRAAIVRPSTRAMS